MQLILILIAALVATWQENVWAANYLSLKSFGFTDSDQVGIWQGLVLYKTDLSDNTALSVRYGLDVVTSASSLSNVLNGTTGASKNSVSKRSYSTSDDREDDDNSPLNSSDSDHERTAPKVSTRQSAGVGLTQHFTHDISGTTSLDLSDKSDYFSYTAGQSLTFPGWDPLTTVSAAGFYTHNHNMPNTSTTNPVMLPPSGNVDSTYISGVLGMERILSKTSKIKVLLEPFTRTGYLASTTQYIPIYSGTATTAALEVLPNKREGYAASAIWSQWLNPSAALHVRGRYYQDTFGIRAWSTDLNWYQSFGDNLLLTLMYRYYSQTEASFWHASLPAVPGAGYFTNHPALSQFNSNEYGLYFRRDVELAGLLGNFNGGINYYASSRKYYFLTYNVGYEVEF